MMRRLTCVFCGKQYIVSKFCKCDAYDYECHKCFKDRKNKEKEPSTKKPKALKNVGERLVNYNTNTKGL